MISNAPSCDGNLVDLAVSSRLENVRLLARAARDALVGRFDEEALIRLEIGLVEAANNVVHHACRDEEGYTIWFSCQLDGNAVILVLEDDGHPPARALLQPAVPDAVTASCHNSLESGLRENGRGLQLMRQCFTSVTFEALDGRNRVSLRFEG